LLAGLSRRTRMAFMRRRCPGRHGRVIRLQLGRLDGLTMIAVA
jgi:hypothetical protein